MANATGFPRRYAGASLKQLDVRHVDHFCCCFPRRYAGASLKRHVQLDMAESDVRFSPALCRGLIEAELQGAIMVGVAGFPRRYAGASLKHEYRTFQIQRRRRFPRRYAGASLKP